ncbi:hypothetical protein FA15DRAFT_416425 [Coprinopsis marcescibilis]|uniref:Uncharacterized protein n=1 Tax=Coprinopsis marcescibilis TaxID=230819 RepID=A0A5C3KV05_COPMA|nr:hypothetical protein FA15DRAFT_416425 [Coprinopsis marcescibilis]
MEQNPKPKRTSFLWLKPSTSSNLGRGGELRSSWTSTDSGNSESILPMSTVTNGNSGASQLASSNSNPNLRHNGQSPSTFLRSTLSRNEAETRTHASPTYSYPPLSNSSLSPSPNPQHARSLTVSTSTSSQGGPVGSSQSHSPRAHPYQLAAYDSINYRSAQAAVVSPPSQIVEIPRVREEVLPPTSTEKVNYYSNTLSPRTPNIPAHTNLLSDRREGPDPNRAQRRRNHRQSLATLASLRILNTYYPPTNGAVASPISLSLPHSMQRTIVISTIFVIVFLAIPVVLSVGYVGVGHAVLRAAHLNSGNLSIFVLADIQGSVEAGAVGGAILGVPIVLILYLLGLFPKGLIHTPESDPSVRNGGSNRQAGQDFFEDDSDTESMKQSCSPQRLSRITVCTLLLLSIGGLSGPLGITVLSPATVSTLETLARTGADAFLTPGAASAAGFVGGAIVIGGVLSLLLITLLTFLLFLRAEQGPPLER